MDDTLFLERDYVRSGFEAVATWVRGTLNVQDFAERAWTYFEAGRRADIFDAVLTECGYPECTAHVRSMVRIYREHAPTISLLPDAQAFLAHARTVCPLALITDGPVESQSRKFAALDLESVFDCVVFTGIWGSHYAKPHERAFRTVERQLGTAGAQYWYIADNPGKDFVTPRALGWTTARIRRPAGLYSMHEGQSAYQPHVEVSDLRELIPFIDLYRHRA